jgi:hypothetical protein
MPTVKASLAECTTVAEYRATLASIASRARSPLNRRLASLRSVDLGWRVRRLRYGPTGRRPVDVRLRARLEGNPPGAWRNAPPAPAAPAAPALAAAAPQPTQ